MKKAFTVSEIRPLDQYDFQRAKICASVRWLLSKSYGSAENVPAELREPFYRDQYEQEHLKPGVSELLISPELYCQAQALLAQAHGVSLGASQGSPGDNSALLQLLTKKGFAPRDQERDETVGRVKMAEEAGQMGAGEPWENALLFWSPSNRWYWKLVPIRYKKDKVLSKMTPTFPLVSGVKDLSNGYVCLKDTMSVADSLYNLHLIKEFCESRLQSCCPLAVEDMLYAPPALHVNIVSFVAELLDCFEVRRPEFVQPVQPLDLTAPRLSSSSSPTCPSPPRCRQGKTWGKNQISRPLSAVTFSIPFGLDSDVDVVMGNPVESFLRSSASTDSLGCTPALTRVPYSPPEDLSHLVSASLPSQHSSPWGLHAYPHTPPSRDLPTIDEALAAALHTPGRGEGRRRGKLSEEEEEAQMDGGRPEPRLRPEGAPAGFFLHSPEGDAPKLSSSAPGRSGMFHRPVGGGGPGAGADRPGRGDRRERPSRQAPDTSLDDDSVLRDVSLDSSEASDDLLPRNAPGNLRPAGGGSGVSHPGHHGNSGSLRMTNFAERRDSRRRQSSAPGGGEEVTPGAAQTPTTPGTPHTVPTTPAGEGHGHEDGTKGTGGPEPGSEASELGARLEEKRKSIEAQKRRIEAIFAKHRQRLGKTAFLQLKREQGEGGGGGAEGKEREEKEEEEAAAGGRAGDVMLEEYNGVVQKLSQALQSLQRDMQKLTEQQQQLMGKPRTTAKGSPKTTAKSTVPRGHHTTTTTPPRTPPRTPTKTPALRGTAGKAWVTPACPVPSSSPGSPARRPPHVGSSSGGGGASSTPVSSSCPAPRTKLHPSGGAHRSPKRLAHQQHHPRPSELKFPPLARVLTPPQNVDTLPHLRRASPSKCQVQTSSSFRIGGPRTPMEVPPPPQQPEETASEAGSSGTPTQFSLELENEEGGGGPGGDLVACGPCVLRAGDPSSGLTGSGGSSSDAPSECSFGSETISLSVAFSVGAGGEAGVTAGGGRAPGRSKASLSSLAGPEGGSDEPTDEGQEFSSDSMSDHTEPALDHGGGPGLEAGSGSGGDADLPGTAGPGSSEERHGSPCPTPPPGTTSPCPTPPATPIRWGEFTRGEYSLRHQLKIMADLGKVLQQKPANQGRAGGKKTRPRARPRSATRAKPQLSQSLDNGIMGSTHAPPSTWLLRSEFASAMRIVMPNDQSADESKRADGRLRRGPQRHAPCPGEMEKSPANHFLILLRDSSCQFRGVYTMNPDTKELVRLAGVGPRTIGPAQVESIYKYSSDRKQFSAIPSKTLGMSVDAFTIPGPLWHGGGSGGSAGGSRRASVTKKLAVSK
ncbi:hypothetical protein CRUP_007242 [Coryphaenoides rupestris]|nr:hypothetical protein CRUP_007242 [Coryphaenoides rupestris]